MRAVFLLSGVLTVVFFITFAFTDKGIAQLQQSRRRVFDMQRDIDHLRSENQRLSAEIVSVKRSTFAIEKIAREDLSMSRNGEVVYMLPPPKK
ncbi:MAG TPA: septum formation initiator family protein [Thermoanaerobaculia bacterium]|nr:septum formation initiator family protein [Thermoanaerobaculia bacterium]